MKPHLVPDVNSVVILSGGACGEVKIEAVFVLHEEGSFLSNTVLTGRVNELLHGTFLYIDQVIRLSSRCDYERCAVFIETWNGCKPTLLNVAFGLVFDSMYDIPVLDDYQVCRKNESYHFVWCVF